MCTKTLWLRVVGRRGQGSGKATIPVVSVLLHRQYWGPPRSESALPWCLSSQLASTHAKRTARGQSGLYGLSRINQAHAKPEKKGTSNPAQPGIVTRKGVYFEWLPEPQGDWLSPWKHKCNLSAWPPAPKLRTNMACFSVWISEQSRAMSPSRLNARMLGLLPFLYPDLIKSWCWRKTSATQTGL